MLRSKNFGERMIGYKFFAEARSVTKPQLIIALRKRRNRNAAWIDVCLLDLAAAEAAQAIRNGHISLPPIAYRHT